MAREGNIKRSVALSRKFGANFLKKGTLTSASAGSGITKIHSLAKEYNWRIFLFGGVPRSVKLEKNHIYVRDFDMVVADENFLEFKKLLNGYIVSRNRFGGLKLKIDGKSYDVWPLSSTWAFRENLIKMLGFSSLTETVFLNIDSIIFELVSKEGNPRKIYESGFFRCLRNRQLDICLESNPFPELCAIRTLKLANETGYSLSKRLAEYVFEVVSAHSCEKIKKIQSNHYHRVYFDEVQLDQVTNKIGVYLESAAEGGINLFWQHRYQTEFDFFYEKKIIPARCL